MKPIETRNLSHTIDGRLVLEAVNFDVEEGEFVGIIGPNGGGKTTLLRILLGLARHSAGTVRVFDENPWALGKKRQLVAYVPQGDTSASDFPATAHDVVLMGRVSLRGMFRPLTHEDREVATAMLAEVGLADQAERAINELSGGQRQRVLIARALATKPRLLLLDEPTTGIDQATEESFFNLLANLKAQFGLAIVMVSHDLTAVSRHCTRIACLNRRIHCHNTPDALDHETLSALFGAHLEFIIHGEIPHRVVPRHESHANTRDR